ncbi:MAG: PIN domain-containing protein [Methylobacterium sp.]
MIIVDTNVVSEMMRARPDPLVEAWFGMRRPADLAITVVSLYELHHGTRRMSPSTERRRLEVMVRALVPSAIGSVVDLDAEAAEAAADIQVRRQSAGRPIQMADALIAGIVRRHDAILSTRNIRDFIDTGISLVNPWQEALP